MSKIIKLCSLSLCAVMLFCLLAYPAVIGNAETPPEVAIDNKTAWVNGTDVNVRKAPTTDSESVGKISTVYVTVTASVTYSDGTVWYKIKYNDIVGYMHGSFVNIIKVVEPAGDFAAQLATFPESYREALKLLHSMYPNWNFIADYVELDFANAVYNQTLNHRKLVSMNDGKSWRAMGSNFNWSTGVWSTYSGNWTDASREVIAYYMDPRNFLTVVDVFMFMQQSYNTSQTVDGVKDIIKGTYLEKAYTDKEYPNGNGSYANVIMEAAKQSGVNPYVLASTLILEQGVNGTSNLISGKSQYGAGYYNFFNYSASGDNVEKNGIEYAKSQGWDTVKKSILGGAIKYGSGYINAGQDTYYYKDFDILDAVPYTHQYAQSIYDAKSSASRLRAIYIDKPNVSLTFRIPVYKNMYATAPTQPAENDLLNNYYFTNISVYGLSPAFSMYTQSYTLSVSGDTTINVSTPSTALYAGEKTYSLKKGENTVVLKVKSQSGYDNSYTLKITAEKDCTLTVSTDGRAVMRGDANGDGKIDIVDIAAVKMHILGKRALTGEFFTNGDANADSKVDIVDLAAIKMHILGKITLK